MANGLAPYILNDISSIAGAATPHKKLDPAGLVALCYNNQKVNPINTIQVNGHKKTVDIWYRQRPTVLMTDTSFSCTDVNIPVRLEATVSVAQKRQIAFMLTDQLVASYNDEASARQNVPGSVPSIGASAELMDIIYSGANALLTGMEQDLLGLVSWGKNVVSGAATATTLAIPQDSASKTYLTNGETKLLSDFYLSGLVGRPQVVGAGMMLNYAIQQAAKSYNAAGMNTAMIANNFDFYPDVTITGSSYLNDANGIGVFEAGSIHVVEALEYQGFAAGQFPGDSIFGVLPLNYTDAMGNTAVIKFDFQLRYITCPTQFIDAYTGSNTSAVSTKGWQLILKKDYGLFQTPSDAFRSDDRTRSVNGALRYVVSNS